MTSFFNGKEARTENEIQISQQQRNNGKMAAILADKPNEIKSVTNGMYSSTWVDCSRLSLVSLAPSLAEQRWRWGSKRLGSCDIKGSSNPATTGGGEISKRHSTPVVGGEGGACSFDVTFEETEH